jgi:NRPS condensation-like uncharacterized protein
MNGYPVELLDEYMRLQEVANDHQIRGIITFRNHLDIDKFKKAVRKSFQYIPVLRCKYSQSGSKAHWEEINFPDEELFGIVEENLSPENIVEYVKRIIDQNRGPQIFIQVIRQEANDIVIIILNHMAFDAAGFKSYLYVLSEIYSGNAADEAALPATISPERRMKILLRNIPLRQKLFSLFRKTLTNTGTGILAENNEDIKTRLRLFQISTAEFQAIKSICKKADITINDFILALFCQSILRFGHQENIADLVIQIMIDLRRYIKEYPVSEFGNFSSMESMAIPIKNRSFLELAREISARMKKMKSNYPGIKNILIMDSLFKLLPGNMFNKILAGRILTLGVSTSNLGVIDDQKLTFGDSEVAGAYMLTSLKNQPSIQVSFSTFKESITLSVLGNYSRTNWEIIESIIDNMAREVNKLSAQWRGL